MSKYIVKRKDVCAGTLLNTGGFILKVYDQNNQEIDPNSLQSQGVKISGGLICRGMLYKLDDENHAEDLVYTTPSHYLIEGKSLTQDMYAPFQIENHVELEELLKYLKYGIDLTQKDIESIYKKLIIHRKWLQKHMELFGWKKIGYNMYTTGGIETIPMEIQESLQHISSTENGKPHKSEPGYAYIKKR